MSLIETALKINVLEESSWYFPGTAVSIFILRDLTVLRLQWRIFYGGKIKFKRHACKLKTGHL